MRDLKVFMLIKHHRHLNDTYFTPRKAVEYLLKYYSIKGRILECCAGKGHISNILKEKGYDVITNDINPNFNSDYNYNAKEFKDFLNIDWTISNPPFNQFLPILKNSYKISTKGVIFLLRLSALEPCYDRWEFFNIFLTGIISIPRISFTNDGKTDNISTAWFIFDKNVNIKTLIITR